MRDLPAKREPTLLSEGVRFVLSHNTLANPHGTNLLSEVVRCGASKNTPPKARDRLCCQKGSDLFYRNKKYRGIVLIVQPTIFCLG